jgi:serine/threonine protein kinase
MPSVGDRTERVNGPATPHPGLPVASCAVENGSGSGTGSSPPGHGGRPSQRGGPRGIIGRASRATANMAANGQIETWIDDAVARGELTRGQAESLRASLAAPARTDTGDIPPPAPTQPDDPTAAETLLHSGGDGDDATGPAGAQPGLDADCFCSPQTSFLRRYDLRERIGSGGVGEVRKAFDRLLGRDVAIKTLRRADSPPHVARFIREAQITSRLPHPNIVPVYDLGLDHQERVYLSMKFVRGRTLDCALGRCRDDGPAPVSEMLDAFQKVADAVAFAHSHGIVHRDLKPANVMVGEFGEVQVMDWGLAGSIDSGGGVHKQTGDIALTAGRLGLKVDGTAGETLDGTVMGTPAYMAPEQAAGEWNRVDGRADIYSLGAMLYELLVGEPPLTGETLVEILNAARDGRIVPPSQHPGGAAVPTYLDGVVMNALRFDPIERFPNVSEMQRQIREGVTAGRLYTMAKISRPIERLGSRMFGNLSLATKLLRGPLDAALRPLDLDMQEYNMLRVLRGAGESGWPAKETADRLVAADSRPLRAARNLVRRGAVAADPAPQPDDVEVAADARLQMTDTGKALTEQAGVLVMPLLERMLDSVSTNDLEQLSIVLDRVLDQHAPSRPDADPTGPDAAQNPAGKTSASD